MFAAFLTVATSMLLREHEEKSFIQFMRNNNMMYTGDEYQFRLGLYLANARRVQEFNSQDKSFTIGLNKFACYTPAEYKALLGVRRPVGLKKQPAAEFTTKLAAPDAKDWRAENAVTAVKDEGVCGACWAFSAIAVCESCYAIHKGQLYTLSEQNLIDCDTYSYGCEGGYPYVVFTHVLSHQNGKFMTETDYPYKAARGTCAWDENKAVAGIGGMVYADEGSESDLKEKIGTMGPASIIIDASSSNFQLYTSGIYDEEGCSPSNPNLACACVGYGTENGVDYWIVKNSWGIAWGDQGYIKIIRNKDNHCGIASEAIIPTGPK